MKLSHTVAIVVAMFASASCGPMYYDYPSDNGYLNGCYVGAKAKHQEDNVGESATDDREEAVYVICANGQEFRIHGESLRVLKPTPPPNQKNP